MKLMLDHVQRLNLHALLGTQRGDVGTVQVLWSLQDKLMLAVEEEKAIELKRDFVSGQERVVWNPALSLPPREFDLTDTEVGRIRTALETWPTYGANADRRWLEPVLVEIMAATALPC